MVEETVREYETRLRQRVGEGEYERHKELVILLARNLAIEDLLWEEILISIRDVDARTELLRQRNTIVKDIVCLIYKAHQRNTGCPPHFIQIW